MYRLKILLETGLVKGLVAMVVFFLLARNFVIPWASNHLGWAGLQSEETSEETQEEAKELDAGDWFSRGLNNYEQGDLESAIADFTKAIEIKPDYAYAYNNRGNAYDEQGDLESAIADYTKAIEIDSDYAEVYKNRGNAYEEQGDLESAIADYTKAIEIDSDYAEVYNAQSASIFSPILNQIERELPRGWVMRLPASNELLKDSDAYVFNWNDMFAVQLTPPDCPATRGNVCISGSIYISKYNSSEIESYQRARRESYAPITLRSGIRGFYTSSQAATGVYRTVIWQQDNQIYRVTGRIGKLEVIHIALSMANQSPIPQ